MWNGQCQHPVEGMGSASTQWREWAVPAPSGGSGQHQHPVEGMGSASRNICYLREEDNHSTVGKLKVLSPTKLCLVERLHCKGL